VSFNNISGLDLSANTALVSLNVENNRIISTEDIKGLENTNIPNKDNFDLGNQTTSIANVKKSDNRYGIRFTVNPVSDIAEITVIADTKGAGSNATTCGRADPAPTVVIYDMTGNVVFECRGGVCPPANNGAIIWDLRNQNGRFVANGTYIVIAEVRDRNGRTHRYSARLGVNR